MMRSERDWLWIVAFAILVTFAVPWFMWGSARVVAGLPVWVWWHVGWMALTAVVFALFTREAWDRGMGVDAGSTDYAGGERP